MTTLMQRPHSTHANDVTYNDNSHSHACNTSHSFTGVNSPPSQSIGTSSELEDQLASLQRELLGETSVSSSTLDMAVTSSNLSGIGERSGSLYGGLRGRGGMERREREENLHSNGLLDDPAVLALVRQPSQMEAGFDLDIAAAQANSSHLVEDAPGHLSDLDLSSAATFQFPELPASLLDQAPEYEYSLHTQANVFDAVQEYGQAGDDEAGRIFGLDQYDPSLLETHQPGTAPGEEFWSYQESSGGVGGAFTHGQMSDYATFHDSSSLSDYPEPSTAPSSRASDWKQEPLTGSYHHNSSFAAPLNYRIKRRRDSFDASFNAPGVNLMSTYGRPVEPMQYPLSHQGQSQYIDVRPLRDNFVQNSRTRMASWGEEALNGQYADDWPPPPAPAPLITSTSSFGPRIGSGVFGNDINHGHSHQHYQGNASNNLPGATNLMNNSMVARMRSTSSDGSGTSTNGGHKTNRNSPHSNHASRTASQNEMINALGHAMDASMESDGVAKCPYPNCSKTFAKNRSYNLKAHLRSHSQLKPFACNHCPRAFSRKHDLERHARVHSGDKPYICEACGKGFPRSDALRRHWRVEKECGEKAVEIEAGQPLPSLPPGINSISAQAKAPTPGMMPSNSSAMIMSNYSSSFSPSQHWDNDYEPNRKRIRGEY